ncbi:hypothetical protein K466DRAFT_228471 [Polyporus arcularius HHB13444]|uniref:DUF6533 domain-containing protein n=1 Tax=Polyporus arcularius HHB13444 TaxID=1314778 RepID=A0A5C3PRR8_9APHY|nr:hypothetical protein K466DRAFT_228471 [Polyporus arcularius HHB13444]
MSSDTDDAAATVVLFDSFSYTENYCDMAVAVLFVYDTIITFDQEVAYFWTAKRIGGASLLFFANKWISLTVYVMLLVSFASFPSDKLCLVCHSRAGNIDTTVPSRGSLLDPPCICVEQEQVAWAARCRFVSGTSRCQSGYIWLPVLWNELSATRMRQYRQQYCHTRP